MRADYQWDVSTVAAQCTLADIGGLAGTGGHWRALDRHCRQTGGCAGQTRPGQGMQSRAGQGRADRTGRQPGGHRALGRQSWGAKAARREREKREGGRGEGTGEEAAMRRCGGCSFRTEATGGSKVQEE